VQLGLFIIQKRPSFSSSSSPRRSAVYGFLVSGAVELQIFSFRDETQTQRGKISKTHEKEKKSAKRLLLEKNRAGRFSSEKKSPAFSNEPRSFSRVFFFSTSL